MNEATVQRKSAEIKDVRIDDPQARYVIQIDGANLVYAEAGSGELLVLLHGYPQSRLYPPTRNH